MSKPSPKSIWTPRGEHEVPGRAAADRKDHVAPWVEGGIFPKVTLDGKTALPTDPNASVWIQETQDPQLRLLCIRFDWWDEALQDTYGAVFGFPIYPGNENAHHLGKAQTALDAQYEAALAADSPPADVDQATPLNAERSPS